MIRYLFFDFGGCIDAPGIHTRTLFWNAFVAFKICPLERKKEFQDAYSLADARLMKSGMAKTMGLSSFNRLQGTLIAEAMGMRSPAVTEACDSITDLMRQYLAESAGTLTLLARQYPLGIISNFTGNLEVILKEEGLHHFFHSITESFYVGANKPDPKIFTTALAKQEFSPMECLYIGDNPKNDILPGKAIGMYCVLIHEPGKKEECGADAYIERLRELPSLLEKIQSK